MNAGLVILALRQAQHLPVADSWLRSQGYARLPDSRLVGCGHETTARLIQYLPPKPDVDRGLLLVYVCGVCDRLLTCMDTGGRYHNLLEPPAGGETLEGSK